MSSNKWIIDLKTRVKEKKTEMRMGQRAWVRARQELETYTTKWASAKTTEDRNHWRQMREDARQRLKQQQERMEELEKERTAAIESLLDVPKAEKPKGKGGRRPSPEAVFQAATLLGDAVELQVRLVSGDVLRVTTRGQEPMIRLFDEMVAQHPYNPAMKQRMDFLIEEKEDFQPLIRSVQEKWSDRFPSKEYPLIHLFIQPEPERETRLRRMQLQSKMEQLRLLPMTTMEDVEEAAKAWWVSYRPKWNTRREEMLDHFFAEYEDKVRAWTDEDLQQMKREQEDASETLRALVKAERDVEEMLTILEQRRADQRLIQRREQEPAEHDRRVQMLASFRERIQADPSGDWLMEADGGVWQNYIQYITVEEMMDAGMTYEGVFGPNSGRRCEYVRKLRDHRATVDELTRVHGEGVQNELLRRRFQAHKTHAEFERENVRVLNRDLPDTL